MVKRLNILLALAVGIAAPRAVAMAADGGSSPASVQRIITFKGEVAASVRLQIVQSYKGTVVHDLGLINAIAAEFPAAGIRTAEVSMKARPEVVRIEADFRQKWIEAHVPAFADVELPAVNAIIRPFKAERHMSEADAEIPWGIARVDAPAAWAKTQGAGVNVGVVDTGIDFDHPDLKANIKGGWNATNKTDNFKDDNGHGTHVSGTIAAVRDGQGVVGVAPKANLYGIKVLDANGSGTFADVIAGIQWTVDHKMDVVNMSLGASKGTDALAEVMKAAAKAGVTIVAAAGNSGGAVGFPAAYPEAIAVSASDSKDALAYFSSRGPQVAFIAPGVNVHSTYMGGGYDDLSGTSMACPHVVGLSALAVAKGAHGPDKIRAALKSAATPLGGLTTDQQGSGLVSAGKLVQ